MDPITQGAIGAVAAQSLRLPKRQLGVAAIAGCLGGMAPDLDILIRSKSDPLLAVEFHRHFTHSLIFIPVGGLIVGALLWLLFFRKRQVPFLSVVLYATLGWATHGLLDACTSYGTQLLWPFSNLRVAWNNVGIVDPLPTLAWLIGCLCAVRYQNPRWARLGFLLGVFYLGLGLVQRERASGVQEQMIAQRGHSLAVRREVKPTILQLFVWRSLYEFNNQFYVDAIYLSAFIQRVYEGQHIEKFNLTSLGDLVKGSVLEKDIARFNHFSDGWVSKHPTQPGFLGDMRYALLPNEIKPLWGIGLDLSRLEQHAPFENFREMGSQDGAKFRAMLRGADLP